MHLVTTNEFVTERQTRHHTTLLQPEDRSKRPREEDSFDGSESHETLGVRRILIFNPSQRPLCLLLHARYRLDRVEQIVSVTVTSVNHSARYLPTLSRCHGPVTFALCHSPFDAHCCHMGYRYRASRATPGQAVICNF